MCMRIFSNLPPFGFLGKDDIVDRFGHPERSDHHIECHEEETIYSQFIFLTSQFSRGYDYEKCAKNSEEGYKNYNISVYIKYIEVEITKRYADRTNFFYFDNDAVYEVQDSGTKEIKC